VVGGEWEGPEGSEGTVDGAVDGGAWEGLVGSEGKVDMRDRIVGGDQ
jgi:hypothetical protein